MTAITIELQGAALVSTQEDVDHISRDTDQRVLRFTWEADGSIEAWLGNSRLNVAGNCTRLTHGLYKHPMEAENDIRHCCHLMAMILEKAQHAVEMLVIRVQAMATARPELARSVEGIELESNDLAPATSTGGERFPVWHRLTSNHDTTAREFFDFYFNYDATAAVVTEHNPSEEFMVDVALTLMDEMDRRTSRAMGAGYGYGYEVDEPEPLALLAEQEFFDVMIRIFPEPGYDPGCNQAGPVLPGAQVLQARWVADCPALPTFYPSVVFVQGGGVVMGHSPEAELLRSLGAIPSTRSPKL